MARVFASGTLNGSADQSDLFRLEDKYTGMIGMLFSGNFGNGNVTLRSQDPVDSDPTRAFNNFDPRDASRSILQYKAPGLYIFKQFFASIIVDLAGATNADIDWVLFLPPRP